MHVCVYVYTYTHTYTYTLINSSLEPETEKTSSVDAGGEISRGLPQGPGDSPGVANSWGPRA